MKVYYNENDPFNVQWLRFLIIEGLIPPGEIDERSIEDVTPNDLDGFTHCHFFAGIGGWPLALQLSNWPNEEHVWTGSCPCQPFSAAGAGNGFDDERHLWPAWRWLIDQRRPSTLFGEQVVSPLGRKWFNGVRVDLERMDFRVGAADLCVAGINAPHIRQRLLWVADSTRFRFAGNVTGAEPQGPKADKRGARRTSRDGDVIRMGNTNNAGFQRCVGIAGISDKTVETPERKTSIRGSLCKPWDNVEWLPCADEKARPTQPGIFPLANGFPNRVGILRGAGNAIVPQLAAKFINIYLEVR